MKKSISFYKWLMPNDPSYQSFCWLLDGPIHSIPSILKTQDSRLSLTLIDPGTFSNAKLKELFANHGLETDKVQQLIDGAHIELFDVSHQEVTNFRIPWCYFKGGAKLDISGRPYRLSFIKPQNTVAFSHYSEHLLRWVGGEGQERVKVSEGKEAGRQWSTVFS